MGVNTVESNSRTGVYKSTDRSKVSKDGKDVGKGSQAADDTAVVYEKSENAKDGTRVNQRDDATIERLKLEAEKRAQSLRDLVEKMLLKQGQTITDTTDIYQLLREGKVDVDPETKAQAQKDIAEDGYWGVNQTSDRLVSFAMALTANDPSKADLMIDSIKKGFDAATKAWGDDLPSLCKDTMDAAIKKLEDWRDSGKKSDSE